MRDRLIKLLRNAPKTDVVYGDIKLDNPIQTLQTIADYLLANGVIVPPKVTGEKVWYVCDGQVQFTLIEGVEPALRLLGFPRLITRQDIGKIVFPTKGEAERELQRKEGDGK